MDVQSLGRYTCCSATVRKHAREAKAWQLLSNVQRPAEDAFFAAARDATAARRSQALRRRVADQLDRWRAGGPMFLNRPITTFADYKFFLRIDDDEGRIWEGDMAPTSQRAPQVMGVVGFDLSKIWLALKDGWDRMVAFLATGTDDVIDDMHDFYLYSLHLTVVAVREADQAMIALGQFSFSDALGSTDEAIQEYDFRPTRRNDAMELKLLSTPQQDFRAFVRLIVTHDATSGGGGTLDSLEVGVDMTKYNADRSELITAEYLRRHRGQYLFDYLASIHHHDRDRALAHINTWENG